MSDASDFAALQRLAPRDALAYLAGREQLTPTYAWQDLWEDEHAHQFTVSRLTRLDLLQNIRDAITQSVAGDLSRTDWTRNVRTLLQDAGWWGKKAITDPADGEIKFTTFDSARLKLIYDTNTRQAFSAGLWERVDRAKVTHPYVRYITKDDDRVRPLHRSWHNLTLPVDHAFWQTHWPPNGWRCRCRVMSMRQSEYDKGQAPNGAALNKAEPQVIDTEYVNPRSGEIVKVPAGIDPGFGYNPGQARRAALNGLVTSKLAAVSPDLAAAALAAGLHERDAP